MEKGELKLPLPWGYVEAKTWGDHNSPPVLVMHGIQDNAGSFDNLIPLLPQSFYYVCIDLPGHGRSSHLPDSLGFTLLTYVEAVTRIVEYLKWKSFYVIGHSLGGHISYYLFSSFPERITKLLVLDAIFSQVIPTKDISKQTGRNLRNLIQFEQYLSAKDPPAYTIKDAVERIQFGRPTKISEEGAELLSRRSLIKVCTVNNEDRYRFTTDQRLKLSIPNYFSFEQIKNFIDNINIPVVIIYAHDSYEIPPGNSVKLLHLDLFKDIKNCKIFVVEGDHDVHIMHPERVAPIISKFLISEKSNL